MFKDDIKPNFRIVYFKINATTYLNNITNVNESLIMTF